MNVPAALAHERAMLAVLRGDAERAIMFASRALANLGEREWMLASHATGYLGVAEWLRGRERPSVRCRRASASGGRPVSPP